MNKLLNEQFIEKTDILKESTENGVRLYLSGVFLGAEKKNRNQRTYPRNIIEREVKNFQSLIESCEALSELNHPDVAEINPDRAACLIKELKMDGNFAIGKALVLSTPCGRIVESLVNDGCRLGMSSRGVGDLEAGGVVAENYHMITIDTVYCPSCPDAYMNAVNEATQWVLNESTGLYIERKCSNRNLASIDDLKTNIDIVAPSNVNFNEEMLSQFEIRDLKIESLSKELEDLKKHIDETFNSFKKSVDEGGSKAISDAFTKFIKAL